jgi:RNA polymerase sigma-70 factor, ECF subfamily
MWRAPRRRASVSAGIVRVGYARRRPTSAVDPELLAAHMDVLYRAACGLCRSHHEAEDLVQETFARVLKRPRVLRRGHEVGYLLRALRHTYANYRRTAARRPLTVALSETDFVSEFDLRGMATARDVLCAIAGAPEPYRKAVLAIDVLGLSYDEAAAHLRTSKATITSRVSRGRERVARSLEE